MSTLDFIYRRDEGCHIRYHRLGYEWWHGLNLFWRTTSAIYVFGWGGYGWVRDIYTYQDYCQTQLALYRVTNIQELPFDTLKEFYR